MAQEIGVTPDTIFLSTPSARRATRAQGSAGTFQNISIHALREEGDCLRQPDLHVVHYFYPRPPRGGRPICCLYCQQGKKFLSTPSARRATGSSPIKFHAHRGFLSTPSARRATNHARNPEYPQQISIHALREEGDLTYFFAEIFPARFLSTPSARRATQWRTVALATGEISIHALREEGDSPPACWAGQAISFLSTPSARRATERWINQNVR